ncbi:MAG: acyltransferase [bacterium]|nr:acyltransferase [bacterium]
MDKEKIYFPNLNGLRFIAALLVIIHHIEQFKYILKVSTYWGKSPFIGIIGNLGVVMFFVLSGFLITYLLLSEEHAFKTISIKKFYIRRILRIWPLYFMLILIAFLILPNISLFTLPGYGKEVVYSSLLLKLVLYALFFPNLVLWLVGVVPYASHTWSIGLEEQYYLIWPVLLKYFKKYRLLLIVLIILIYMGFAQFLETPYSDFIPHKNVIVALWGCFNIDCMAIGGFYAILLFKKNWILSLITNTYFFYLTILFVSALMFKGIFVPIIHYEFYAVLFGIIILNFAVNKKMHLSLENKVMNYLGSISYGLYMYHSIGIVLSIAICISLNLTSNWFIYPMCFIITILLASISFKYFEKFFLKFKPKFSPIISGNDTKVEKS